MFLVPKVAYYISIVYNVNSSGLNYASMDPHFAFPTVMNTLRAM